MPALYYQDIKLNGNSLQDARIENVGALPGSGTLGQMVYLTTNDLLYVWDGTQWQALVYSTGGSFISTITAGSGITVTGTGNSRTVSHADTSSVVDSSNTGATVIQSITFDTFGHVQSIGTKTLTASDVGADNYGHWTISDGKGGTENIISGQTLIIEGTGATTATYNPTTNTLTISSVNTTYGIATSTTPGLVELFSDTVQTVAANAVSSASGKTYGVQLNGSGQMVVNVPWVNTTYSNGTGLSLTGTTFALTGQALALHNFGGTGFVVRTGASSFAGRSLVQGSGISIANTDGIAGNPTITNTDRGSSQTIYKTIGGDTGTDSANTNSDTLNIVGDTYISTAVTAPVSGTTQVAIDLDIAAVETALNLGAGGDYVTVAGAQTIAGAKTFSAGTVFNANVTFNGDIIQNGARVLTAPETVQIEDNLAVYNFNFTGTPVDDSGFIVERGTANNVGFIWDESADEWAMISTTDDGTGTGNIVVSGYENLRVNNIFLQSVVAGTADYDKFLVLDGTQVKSRTGAQVRSDIGAGVVNEVTVNATGPLAVDGGATATKSSASVSFDLTVSDATTSSAGVVELATDAEARAGVAGTVITASNLSALNAKANIGDNSNTSFTINHSLNSTDVIVQVVLNSTGERVYPKVTTPTAGSVQVNFSGIVPTANQFRVLIMLLA